MAETPSHMQKVDREELYTSLPARIQYLHSFLEFGPDDVEALIEGQRYIKAVIPAIVNIVYKKLLKYDITARAFTTRDTRNTEPIDHWVTEDSSQIQNRKMFLRWYLTKLNSDPSKMEYWAYLNKVGQMHMGKHRRNPLHVDYIFLGACLAYIQDSLFEAILSHPRLDLGKKIALTKALGKVIWIQNDLFARWHCFDGEEYLDPADEENMDCEGEGEREGYLHGKRILGRSGSGSTSGSGSASTNTAGKGPASTMTADDDASMHSSASSGKTSLGRPIEDATHLAQHPSVLGLNGPGPHPPPSAAGEDPMSARSRCPFSGMSFPKNSHDDQRATSSRSAAAASSGLRTVAAVGPMAPMASGVAEAARPRNKSEVVLQPFHKPGGTQRVKLVDGKVVLKEEGERPFYW